MAAKGKEEAGEKDGPLMVIITIIIRILVARGRFEIWGGRLQYDCGGFCNCLHANILC